MASDALSALQEIQARMARLRGGGRKPSVDGEHREQIAIALGEMKQGIDGVIRDLRHGGDAMDIYASVAELALAVKEINRVVEQLR